MTIALSLMMLTWLMTAVLVPVVSYAVDDDEYTYTVTVYSGKEGYFGSEDKHVVKYTGLKYDEELRINVNDLDLQLVDSDKYYTRGLKISGHDNDEVNQVNYMSVAFKVKGDESFSVAYGIKGGMVKYTVRYVDASDPSNVLSAEDVYYGMVGDKPVVSYKYIDGYLPNAYNMAKTISDNEADNVFTFSYYSTATGGGGEEGGGGTAGTGGAGGAAGAGAGEGAANIGENATPQAGPADYVDLDDNQTPTTNAPGTDATDIDDNKTPGVSWPVLGGGAVVILGIAAAAIALARRRGSEEEEE